MIWLFLVCQNESEDSLMKTFVGRIGVSLMLRYQKTQQWIKVNALFFSFHLFFSNKYRLCCCVDLNVGLQVGGGDVRFKSQLHNAEGFIWE